MGSLERHNNKLAAEHFPGLIIIRELAGNTAVLAILIPAEAAVRNRLGTDELETSQKRVPLRNLKLSAKNGDLDELLVRTKWL
jgi:hypothetical protein